MGPGWLGLMPCRKFDSHIAENWMVRRIQLFGGAPSSIASFCWAGMRLRPSSLFSVSANSPGNLKEHVLAEGWLCSNSMFEDGCVGQLHIPFQGMIRITMLR